MKISTFQALVKESSFCFFCFCFQSLRFTQHQASRDKKNHKLCGSEEPAGTELELHVKTPAVTSNKGVL